MIKPETTFTLNLKFPLSENMAIHITPNEAGDGVIIGDIGDGIEYGDAIKYFSESKISMMAMIYRKMVHAKNPLLTAIISDDFFIAQGKKRWQLLQNEITATPIPTSFITLLNSTSKAEQEKLLRGQSLTSFQYAALLFESANMGYTFSSYRSEKLPSDVEEQEMPKLLRVNGDKVLKRRLRLIAMEN